MTIHSLIDNRKAVFLYALERINAKFNCREYELTLREPMMIVLYSEYERVWDNNLRALMEYNETHDAATTNKALIDNAYAWLAKQIVALAKKGN